VQDILKAGIKVVTSINIQYIAEMCEQVAAITGKCALETVPISFLKSASVMSRWPARECV
jgi:K+-sensing histidine kinase KdpD